MKLSRKFLSEYIDLTGLDFNDIAKKMVLVGNEYESVSKMCNATNLVVGHVLECEKHPESTKLSICQVDLWGEVKQILCGAPNVKKGINVIVAKVGATLPGGLEIKEAKLAGMTSNGMICSLLELGFDSKYLTEEDKTGIHILGDDAKVGMDALTYLNLDDDIIDFELTSNRADLLSVLGMAYEVGAIYNRNVTLPNTNVSVVDSDINTTHKLVVETENCPLYLAKLVKNVVIKESPNFIKSRLIASGIRPINNVVDISNYVMLEFGQPLHFFDALKVGSNLLVRMAHEDEEIVTLDGVKRSLTTSDIVITDSVKPIALAGVMGGSNSEVDSNTKDILIESAIFAPLNIRNTSKNILRSEASSRFEKGIDPNRTLLALNRACYLLNKYASGSVTTGVLTHDVVNKEEKIITIGLGKINSVLGMSLTADEVIKIFKQLGFKAVNNYEIEVTVPTRRVDISIKEDLIEEIGRIHGYDNLISKLPVSSIRNGNYNRRNKLVREVANILKASGLNQVLTYSLIKEKDLELFTSSKKEAVILQSPLSEDRKVMRQSLVGGLYEVYLYNTARNIKDVTIFETGKIYYKEDSFKEQMVISGLLSGNYTVNNWQGNIFKVDFYLVKGIVENLLNYLGFNNRYQFRSTDIPKDYHPSRSASIYVDNNLIGFIGQINPSLEKKEVYIFELNFEKLLTLKVRGIKFKDIPKYPSISKDLAFVFKKDVTAASVIDIIKKVAGKLLVDIDVFDVYLGENVLADEKSVAFSLTFQDSNMTLSDVFVNELVDKIINEVTIKANGKLRSK